MNVDENAIKSLLYLSSHDKHIKMYKMFLIVQQSTTIVTFYDLLTFYVDILLAYGSSPCLITDIVDHLEFKGC